MTIDARTSKTSGRRTGTRKARLALAVSPDHLVVARLRRGPLSPRVLEVLECTLAPPQRGAWPELEEALRELAATLGISGGTVDVALLRRLGHAKVVPLPPVRASELPGLVRRNARRHFAVRDEALAADAARLPGPRQGALQATLAACAPAALVDTVAAACAAAGFRVGGMVPGSVALAEVSRSLLTVARRGRVAAVEYTATGGDLVLLEDGVPRMVQPLPPAADAHAAWERVSAALRGAEEDGRAVACVAVLGSGEDAVALRRAVAGDETYGPRLAQAPAAEEIPAEALLALGAALAGGARPVLLPDSLLRERARRARRRTAAMAAGAFVLTLFSAGMHLYGLHREIDAVEARRRQIATQVKHAREARANVEGVRSRLQAIAALEKASDGWTDEIAALARALPDSAHLRTLSADSTGLRLAGIARSASAVVPALEASPAFERVSLAAPVRWQQGDAGERFDVAAALQPGRGRRPAPAPASPSSSASSSPSPSPSPGAVSGSSGSAPDNVAEARP